MFEDSKNQSAKTRISEKWYILTTFFKNMDKIVIS